MLHFLQLQFTVFVLCHLVKRLLGARSLIMDHTRVAVLARPALVRRRVLRQTMDHVTVLTPRHETVIGLENNIILLCLFWIVRGYWSLGVES